MKSWQIIGKPNGVLGAEEPEDDEELSGGDGDEDNLGGDVADGQLGPPARVGQYTCKC